MTVSGSKKTTAKKKVVKKQVVKNQVSKKKVATKNVTKKVTPKKAAPKKVAPKKTAPKTTTTKASSAKRKPSVISNEEKRMMVAMQAYYKWELAGFPGGQDWQHWLEAEKEVDEMFK